MNTSPTKELAIVAPKNNVVTFCVVKDCFDMSRENQIIERVPLEPRTLREYLGDIEALNINFMLFVNGIEVVDVDNYGMLAPEDFVSLIPIPHGGDGGGDTGKQIMRLVAVITLAYFTFGAGGIGVEAEAATWLGTSGTFTAYLAASAVMIGGSMLINSLFKPDMPKNDDENDRNYGIDGAFNTSKDGIPVPVCFGKFRTAGNFIGTYTYGTNPQRLRMLIAVGEGESEPVTDIELNERPLSQFKNVEVGQRPGVAGQLPVPLFADTITSQAVGVSLNALNDTTTITTVNPCERLRLEILMPSGLYRVKDDGELRKTEIELEIHYRQVGTSEWFHFKSGRPLTPAANGDDETVMYLLNSVTGNPHNPNDFLSINFFADQGTAGNGGYAQDENGEIVGVFGHTNIPDIGVREDSFQQYQGGGDELTWTQDELAYAEAVDYTNGDYTNIVIRDADRNPTRRHYYSRTGPLANYEIRITRLTDEGTDKIARDLTITALSRFETSDIAYEHTALLAMDIRLDDQLNRLPRVTYLNNGIKLDVWDGTAWQFEASSNPAWIAWNILTNDRWGGGLDSSRLDLDAFYAWAQFCDAESFEFNGAFSVRTNVWDALMSIMAVGRGRLVTIGTRYSVSIYEDKPPSQLFNATNIIKGTFTTSWLPLEDRANEIDITFYDKDNRNKERTITVYDPDYIINDLPQRKAEMTLIGVDNETQALKDGTFALNLNKLTQMITFKSPLESIAVSLGDVIRVQHEMPDFGIGGRLLSGSTTTVMNLDREITMENGKSYRFLTSYDAIVRASDTVSSVTAQNITLNGWSSPNDNPQRIVINGTDYRVTGVYFENPLYGVTVEGDTSGVSPSDSYTLYSTDVMEERDVVLSVGTSSSITLASALPSAPSQYTNFAFGEVGNFAKEFMVTSIGGSHNDHTRDISALEFDSAVFIDTPAEAALAVQDPRNPINKINNLQVDYERSTLGDTTETIARFSWEHDQPDRYRYCDIYYQSESTSLTKAGEGVLNFQFKVNPEVQYRFFFLAVDDEGVSQTIETSLYIDVEATDVSDDVTGIQVANLLPNSFTIKWDKPVVNTDIVYQPSINDKYYEVWLYEDPSKTATPAWDDGPGTYTLMGRTRDNSFTLTDLIEDVDHYVYIISYLDTYAGSGSNPSPNGPALPGLKVTTPVANQTFEGSDNPPPNSLGVDGDRYLYKIGYAILRIFIKRSGTWQLENSLDGVDYRNLLDGATDSTSSGTTTGGTGGGTGNTLPYALDPE